MTKRKKLESVVQERGFHRLLRKRGREQKKIEDLREAQEPEPAARAGAALDWLGKPSKGTYGVYNERAGARDQ